MTKRKNIEGMTDDEFNALVDEGFRPSERERKRGGNRSAVWAPSAALRRELERDGQQEGLTKSAARFNGALSKIFGTAGAKLSPESVKCLNEFDAAARVIAKGNGIELVDDDDERESK